MPIYVGEFGINYRWGCCGELEYLKDTLEVLRSLVFTGATGHIKRFVIEYIRMAFISIAKIPLG